MPLVILHHLLKVSVQLANKRGLKEKFLDVLALLYTNNSDTHLGQMTILSQQISVSSEETSATLIIE
jgi:hypothetical protein